MSGVSSSRAKRNGSCVAHGSCLVLALLAVATGLLAQSPAELKPWVGQPGKDVIWLPSPEALVERMLDMAQVTPQDFLIDLGSGDGRMVISAAKRGAHAMGVEYNPDLIELSKKNAAAQGVADKATFIKADLFETDLSKATVITLFLRPDLNLKLRPKLLDLKAGTRIVSNTFEIGDWEPDETIAVGRDCATWCFAMMWIVPAKVQGTWRLPQGDMTLTQTFQRVTGTLRTSRGSALIIDGRLRADRITFSAGSARYSGRVNGTTIEGTVTAGGSTMKWTATLVETVGGHAS